MASRFLFQNIRERVWPVSVWPSFSNRAIQISRDLDQEHFSGHEPLSFGVPQHFGLYYAIGLAMIFESFFSAAYHVCPTPENFQFDTTFMYDS